MDTVQLPGLNVPLDWGPEELYPICVDPESEWRQNATTLRELWMLRFMNEVTDEANWEKKVMYEKISNKYKAEAMGNPNNLFSHAMAEFAIKELRHKAKLFEETSMTSVFDPGVMKSDNAISNDTKQRLQNAVKLLEDVKESDKDWHPGSGGKVLDLVHPSLFPLVYGYSKILEDSTVDLGDPVASTGLGLTAPEQETIVSDISYGNNAISYKFQWLPCEVEIGKDKNPRIRSYINNLHPHKNNELYHIVEEILSAVMPLWSETLKSLSFSPQRIWYEGDAHDIPKKLLPQRRSDEDETDWYEREYEEMDKLEREFFRYPEPDLDRFEFKPPEASFIQDQFSKQGLQVIVKLANIHLTPSDPIYEGGTWHFEGQLNEHICSTAIYYYDCSNITESRLSFRQGVDPEEFDGDGWSYGPGRPDRRGFYYEQNKHAFLELVFGLGNEEPALQDVGSVLCREGRLITFPNVLQHKVQPFELMDKTKAGHRKILALFLVDPHMKIISTANVPPQRKDWWEEKLWAEGSLGNNIPLELHRQICDDVEGFPFDLETAKKWRQELMEERSSYVVQQEQDLEEATYSLCEH